MNMNVIKGKYWRLKGKINMSLGIWLDNHNLIKKGKGEYLMGKVLSRWAMEKNQIFLYLFG